MTANPSGRLLDGDELPPGQESPPAAGVRRRGYAVVALSGEHDISNVELLVATIRLAVSANDANLVLDLRRVEYMSASTIHIIERTRQHLGVRSRSVTLRSPSPIARRLLDMCHVADCVQPSTVAAARPDLF